MAVSLKGRVCYLIFEFLAHTYVVLGSLQLAGAVAACSPESLFYSLYDFLIFV